MAGLIALLVALVVATAIGLVLRRRSGVFRTTGASAAADLPPGSSTPVASDPAVSSGKPTGGGNVLTEGDLGTELGERATLVQFSTAFCAPCRPTRLILAQVADMVDGVRHVEIDAAERMDLVARLRINSTPTILVLGPDGSIGKRASGLPRKADVIAALGQVIDPGLSTTSTTLIDNTGNTS
jgi:thiol-disulfide isomerase/thioredoxin